MWARSPDAVQATARNLLRVLRRLEDHLDFVGERSSPQSFSQTVYGSIVTASEPKAASAWAGSLVRTTPFQRHQLGESQTLLEIACSEEAREILYRPEFAVGEFPEWHDTVLDEVGMPVEIRDDAALDES